MIIQCPECETRFRMADDKLKPEGTKVRCSRCRHIFIVTPPEEETRPASPIAPPPPATQDSGEEIDFGSFNMESVAEDASPGTSAEPPAAAPLPEPREDSQDFTGDLDLGLEPPAAAPRAASAGPDSAAPSADEAAFAFDVPAEEEGSFSFDQTEPEETTFSFENPAAEVSAEQPAAEEEGFSFEQPAGEAEQTFSFDPSAEDDTGGIAFDEPAGSEAEEPFAGSADPDPFSFDEAPNEPPEAASFAGLDETAEETGAAVLGAAEFSFEDEPSDSNAAAASEEFSLEGNSFSFDEKEPDWQDAGQDGGFDFEEQSPAAENSGDEFDFSNISFGEEEAPQVETASPPQPEVRPELAAATQRPAETADFPERDPAPLVMPPGSRRSRRSPISGVLVFVLLLLIGLSGAAGYFLWQGGLPAPSQLLDRLTGQAAPAAPEGQVRITDLHGYFVANQEAGQLFVIQGKAVNEFKEARSAIAVKGILYDQRGKPILQQTVFSGNLLQEPELLNLPFAQIEERMNNQFGDSLSNLNVGTGKAIPFTIVFRNLPGDLAEFTVEVADSRPGSG